MFVYAIVTIVVGVGIVLTLVTTMSDTALARAAQRTQLALKGWIRYADGLLADSPTTHMLFVVICLLNVQVCTTVVALVLATWVGLDVAWQDVIVVVVGGLVVTLLLTVLPFICVTVVVRPRTPRRKKPFDVIHGGRDGEPPNAS